MKNKGAEKYRKADMAIALIIICVFCLHVIYNVINSVYSLHKMKEAPEVSVAEITALKTGAKSYSRYFLYRYCVNELTYEGSISGFRSKIGRRYFLLYSKENPKYHLMLSDEEITQKEKLRSALCEITVTEEDIKFYSLTSFDMLIEWANYTQAKIISP